MTRPGRATALAALLCAATLALYSDVTRNGFLVYDDYLYVTKNGMVTQGLTLEGARWAFQTTHAANWHPLTWLSHMLDVELFGLDPAGHHAVGALLHALNALLLFAALNALTGALWPSALVAALFAVHPLHVESVAWASERKDLLSTLFALLALIAWLRAVRSARPGPGHARAAALFALALMAKPMPVTFPFVLLLLDWWPLGRWNPAASPVPGRPAPRLRFLPPPPLWREKLPLFLLAAASCTVTYFAQGRGGAIAHALPLGARLENVVVSYSRYLAKTLLPDDLSVFYPLPRQGHPAALIVLSILFVTATSYLVARAARRRPWLGIGWLWYLGTLVPAIGIIQVGSQSMADRYTYLPLTGIFIAAAWSLREFTLRLPRVRVVTAASAVAVILALSPVTRARTALWADTFTLFEDALATDAGNWVAHDCIGIALGADRRYAEAIPHYRTSLALRPGNADLLSNLGHALAVTGNPAEAETLLRQAVRTDPRHPQSRINLGNLLAARGEFQTAEKLFREALRLDEINAEARSNLGTIFAAEGRYIRAVEEFRKALRLDPTSAETRVNLGVALRLTGNLAEAVAEFREAVRIDPALPQAHISLGESLAASGALGEAAAAYREAIRLDPGAKDAHFNLGRLLQASGKASDAQVHFQEALRIDPSDEDAREALSELGRALPRP